MSLVGQKRKWPRLERHVRSTRNSRRRHANPACRKMPNSDIGTANEDTAAAMSEYLGELRGDRPQTGDVRLERISGFHRNHRPKGTRQHDVSGA
jgi:hypothetical protein